MARIFKHNYTKPLPEGAELFTRKGRRCARFRDSKGKSVTAPLSQDGKKVVIETAKWYIEYKDADGIMRRVPGCKDKQATAKMASDLDTAGQRGRTGLIDKHAEQRKRPLSEHIEDWEKLLKARGNNERYAEGQAKYVRAMTQGCRFLFWPDLCGIKVQSFVADMRKATTKNDGISARTANGYLQACKQFCNWMVRNDRAPNNPLSHLQRYNIKTDRRVIRRALTFDECQRLLIATQNGGPIFKMTGAERAMLYRVALGTGFRAAELRSLRPANFDLETDLPTISVEAAYSKHRKQDIQPISRQLADMLRLFLVNKDPEEPVFSPHSDKTADMLRADLRAADIDPVDSAGTRIDFHALRHTFITLGAQAGIAPKALMDLARHSDINLTMSVYSHSVIADRAKALEAIPDFMGDADQGQVQKATGTYNAVPNSVPFSACNHKQNNKQKTRFSQVNAPPGIRTPDPLIKSQLLCQLS